MKKPRVNLINWTDIPIETMCYARRVMHAPVPDTLGEFRDDPEKWLGMSFDRYVDEVLLKDGMPTFLEYVHMVFKLENVSRALTHQLVRHRIGFSFSQQSLRCVSLPTFAEDGHYHNPYDRDQQMGKFEEYHDSMLNIQDFYNRTLLEEHPMQNARGLLPMNIFTTITFSCTLRAFIGMINKRLCLKTQGEFREVADLMLKEIEKKMDPRILKWVGRPCELYGKCMMEGENYQQYKEGKLKGKQNTDHVCPLYLKMMEEKKNEV